MRLLRVGQMGEERPAALTPEGALVDLSEVVPDITADVIGSRLDAIREALGRSGELPLLDATALRIGSAIANPGKIVCVGLNYKEHAAEAGQAIPDEPILFMKAPYTLAGPDDEVPIPPHSHKTDYEVELAVVIGETARYLSRRADSLSHVAGYAVSDDVSEREFQLERGGQWDKGKNCEGFNPFGPWFVTSDDVVDPRALDLELAVNGETRQHSSTADMIFSVEYLIWYISQFMTLLPGDVINTGTPQGVGSGFNPTRFLTEGDVVDISITGLGNQRHRFYRASADS